MKVGLFDLLNQYNNNIRLNKRTMNELGIKCAVLKPGDALYFLSDCYHEIHYHTDKNDLGFYDIYENITNLSFTETFFSLEFAKTWNKYTKTEMTPKLLDTFRMIESGNFQDLVKEHCKDFCKIVKEISDDKV